MGNFEEDLKRVRKNLQSRISEFERKTAISRKIKIFVKKYCI